MINSLQDGCIMQSASLHSPQIHDMSSLLLLFLAADFGLAAGLSAASLGSSTVLALLGAGSSSISESSTSLLFAGIASLSAIVRLSRVEFNGISWVSSIQVVALWHQERMESGILWTKIKFLREMSSSLNPI
jgi:hypothetical protein